MLMEKYPEVTQQDKIIALLLKQKQEKQKLEAQLARIIEETTKLRNVEKLILINEELHERIKELERSVCPDNTRTVDISRYGGMFV